MEHMSEEITLAQDPDRLRVEAEMMSARVRGTLTKFADRAAQILQELAEFGDNDRIRLSAVNSILDRAGVVAPQQIQVTATQEQHALIRSEAEETLERLRKNVAHAQIEPKHHAIEAVIVHEGVEESELT